MSRRVTRSMSNFTSKPRHGKATVGSLLRRDGLPVLVPDEVRGKKRISTPPRDVYVGGHGMRSERETYRWIARALDVKVVELELTDPTCTTWTARCSPHHRADMVSPRCTRTTRWPRFEEETGIMDVSVDDAYQGNCNSVRLGTSSSMRPISTSCAGERRTTRSRPRKNNGLRRSQPSTPSKSPTSTSAST